MSEIFVNIELPESWSWAKSKEIGIVINGDRGKNYPSRQHYIKSGIPFLSAGNLDEGKIDKSSLNYISVEKYNELNNGKLQSGDIIYCLRGTLGKCAAYDLEGNAAIASSLAILRPSELINKKYLLYFLQCPFGIKLIKHFDNGTAQPNLSGESFSNYDFPIAPIPEQHRIVAKIEELFSSLDKGIESLKTAQAQLKVYRQAVLKWAFEGVFTIEWRKNRIYSLENFLHQLKHQKEDAIKNKLIKRDNYFEKPDNQNIIYNVPENWLQLPWKTITSNNKYALKRGPFGSALKKEFFVEKGYTVFEQGHAINDDPYRDRYFITEQKYKELEAFAVKPGDMIVSCSGVTLGRICLLPEDCKPGIINQALLKIDLDEKIVLKKYFIMMFRSETFQRKIFQKSLGTAMSNMVGMEELKELIIPIPSIEEQEQIVQEIEFRLSVCDKIEESITTSLLQAEALRQSILKKAFEGKLVPQDPNDEPASKLLERIKAEREAIRQTQVKNKVSKSTKRTIQKKDK